MATILIVHRTSDAQAESGRLFDSLARGMPDVQIATNIEAIPAEPNGGRKLRDLPAPASLVVALIGRSWLTTRDDQQRRRIDDPNDIVRSVLERAFAARIPVVPVLVQGAQLPSSADLPAALIRLSTAAAIQLRHIRWGHDVARLIDRLERALSEQKPAHTFDVQGPPPRFWFWRVFAARMAATFDALGRRAVRRSRYRQAIKRGAMAALLVSATVGVYTAYRYVAAADVRRVHRIAEELTYDAPIEAASSRLGELRAIVVQANDRAVTDAAVNRLKDLVAGTSKSSADGRRLRREAMELLKEIRRNDLSSVFTKQELAKVDLFRVDLSSAVLHRVSLESAWLLGVKFTDADLSGTDLSGAYIRNADFTRANLTGANVGELDWYNAHGFTEAQLKTVQLPTLDRCPRDSSSAHSVTAFQAKFVKDYGLPWEKFAERDRGTLTKLWQEYGKPAGLCGVVDRWLE